MTPIDSQNGHPLERLLLILLLLVYAVIGGLYAIRTPDWQAPDEPAHYNYVAQVATNGCCPVLEVGDWNSAYLDRLKAAHFRPDLLGDLATIQYEDHQPPLYYLLASVIFRLTSGSVLALRLFSVLLGAGVVAGAYAVGKALLPDQPQIALGAAALVAFVPQHLAMLAAVENDSLAELVVAVTLWLTVIYLKTERIKTWQLGLLVGVGLLTKVSTLFLIGLVPLAILIKWWIGRDRARPLDVGAQRAAPLRGENSRLTALLRELVLFAVPALILGGIWWAREISVYGFPDLFGLGRHNLVVADQPRTAELIGQIGMGAYLRQAVSETFDSFWGQFGWMALPLQPGVYAALLIGLIAAAAGWMVGIARPLVTANGAAQRAAWAMLDLTALLALAQFVYYNLEFLQLQGRYLYPGLIPFGLIVALGFDGWRRLLFGQVGRGVPRPYSMWFAPAVIALLIPLNLYIVWRVLPGLAP